MISTLISFIVLSELGVGPGLTNILAKSIAAEDHDQAQQAFSTAFVLTVLLAGLGTQLAGVDARRPRGLLEGPRARAAMRGTRWRAAQTWLMTLMVQMRCQSASGTSGPPVSRMRPS